MRASRRENRPNRGTARAKVRSFEMAKRFFFAACPALWHHYAPRGGGVVRVLLLAALLCNGCIHRDHHAVSGWQRPFHRVQSHTLNVRFSPDALFGGLRRQRWLKLGTRRGSTDDRWSCPNEVHRHIRPLSHNQKRARLCVKDSRLTS